MLIELGIDTETKRPIFLKEQDRVLNNVVVGPVGSGKTLFLLNGIHQDVKEIAKQNMNGISVFETDGSLARRIQSIAEYEGLKEVTIIDPTSEQTFRFNPLKGEFDDVLKAILNMLEDYFFTLDKEQAEVQKEALKHIVFAIKHSHQQILGLHTIKYCVQSPEFLVKILTRCFGLINTEEYRDKYQSYQKELKKWIKKTIGITIQHGKVKYYYKVSQNFKELGSYLQKLNENEYVKNIFSANPSEVLDFDKLLEQGKVLLVSVSKEMLGEQLASVLGKYILTRLEQALIRRPYEKDSLHHILIDDPICYVSKEFPNLLAQTRKHHLSVTLATTNLRKLADKYGEGFIHRLMVNLRNTFVFGGIETYDARLFSPIINEGRMASMEITTKDLIIQDAFMCTVKIVQDSYPLPAKEIKIHYPDGKI